MRIAVFGTGGVGGYFGLRLAEAGHDVAFIARGTHLDAIRRNGLKLISPIGNYTHSNAFAVEHAEEVGEVDAVLLGVKAWQVPSAAQAIRPLIGSGTLVLPLQNGVEAHEQLIEVLGEEPVIGGTCRIIAMVHSPGVIQHLSIDPSIVLGELDHSHTERAESLAGALRAAGIRTEVADHIHAALWKKFIFIASISGIGALTRVPFGRMRQIPGVKQMYADAIREVTSLAQARNIPIANEYADQLIAHIENLPHEGTASMQRDIMDGKPSELEAQNGAVVRLGAEAGVPTPVHQFIYHALLPQEQLARDIP